MSKGINQAVIAELAKDSFRMAHLVDLELSTSSYLTDYHHDIFHSSTNYAASGHLLETGDISESQDLQVGSIDIRLSGKNQTYIALLLNNDWFSRSVTITRILIDVAGDVIGEAGRYVGTVTNFTIENDDVVLTVASHWADFDRVTGRRTNDNSQQSYYPGDTGMSRAAQIVKDIKWGRE
jgi:hypothetical protein